MDHSSSASAIEVLIDVAKGIVDPSDLLIMAVDHIRELREELDNAHSATMEANFDRSNLRLKVEELERFKAEVTALDPDIELALLRKRLRG